MGWRSLVVIRGASPTATIYLSFYMLLPDIAAGEVHRTVSLELGIAAVLRLDHLLIVSHPVAPAIIARAPACGRYCFPNLPDLSVCVRRAAP